MTEPDSAPSGAASHDPVGSVAEEAFKLFRALTVQPSSAGDASATHVCDNAWCPACQIVGFVRDNPDALAGVAQSAAAFTRSLRDLFDSATAPQDET